MSDFGPVNMDSRTRRKFWRHLVKCGWVSPSVKITWKVTREAALAMAENSLCHGKGSTFEYNEEAGIITGYFRGYYRKNCGFPDGFFPENFHLDSWILRGTRAEFHSEMRHNRRIAQEKKRESIKAHVTRIVRHCVAVCLSERRRTRRIEKLREESEPGKAWYRRNYGIIPNWPQNLIDLGLTTSKAITTYYQVILDAEIFYQIKILQKLLSKKHHNV